MSEVQTKGCSRSKDGKHVWTWSFLKGWVCVGCGEVTPRLTDASYVGAEVRPANGNRKVALS